MSGKDVPGNCKCLIFALILVVLIVPTMKLIIVSSWNQKSGLQTFHLGSRDVENAVITWLKVCKSLNFRWLRCFPVNSCKTLAVFCFYSSKLHFLSSNMWVDLNLESMFFRQSPEHPSDVDDEEWRRI